MKFSRKKRRPTFCRTTYKEIWTSIAKLSLLKEHFFSFLFLWFLDGKTNLFKIYLALLSHWEWLVKCFTHLGLISCDSHIKPKTDHIGNDFSYVNRHLKFISPFIKAIFYTKKWSTQLVVILANFLDMRSLHRPFALQFSLWSALIEDNINHSSQLRSLVLLNNNLMISSCIISSAVHLQFMCYWHILIFGYLLYT